MAKTEMRGTQIKNSTITAADLADSTITARQVADSMVTTVKIADSTVTADKIADGAIETAKLGNTVVTTAQIANSTITADKLVDGAIETAKIALSAVTLVKIADSVITAKKIKDGTLPSVKLMDSTILSQKIADSTILSRKIVDSTILSRKIADSAITLDKLGLNSGFNVWLVDVTLSDGGSMNLGTGTLTAVGATLTHSLNVTAADGVADGEVVGHFENQEGTLGRNYGVYIKGGSDAGDYALLVQDRDGNDVFQLRGDRVAYFYESVVINGPLGIGTPANAWYPIYNSNTSIDTPNQYRGIYNDHIKTAGATNANDDFYGIYSEMQMWDTDSTIGDLTGIRARAYLNTGTVGDGDEAITGGMLLARVAGGIVNGDVVGAFGEADINNGTINGNVYGGWSNVDIEGTVTSIDGNVYGHYIYVDVDKAPTGSVYMLYLDEVDGVNYGIYQAGTAANVLPGTLASGAITSTGTSLFATAGVGIARTEGTLHVHTASAGAVTAATNSDDLVVESSENTGITILCGAGSDGRLTFGDETKGEHAAQINYHSATGDLIFQAPLGGIFDFRNRDAQFAGTLNIGNGFGMHDVAVQAQQAHIINADGSIGDITTKFNALLADLEGFGFLDT